MLFFLISSVWVSVPFIVLAKNYPECNNNDKLNTFVASKASCSKYIYCDGENSFEGECFDGNIFDEIKGNCDDPQIAVCNALGSNGNQNNGNDGQKDNGNTDAIDSNNNNNNNANKNQNNDNDKDNEISASVAINSNQYQVNKPIIDTNNTKPSIALTALSPNRPPPSPSPASQSGFPSVFSPSFSLPSSPSSLLPNRNLDRPHCPLTDDGNNVIQFPNPASCAAFYTCYNGIAIPMNCGRNMYFNVQNGKCEPQEKVHCALDRPIRLQCSKGIYDYMPHPRNCDYYYFCANGFQMILQCPFKFTWHYERHTCVHQSQSKCFSTAKLMQNLNLLA